MNRILQKLKARQPILNGWLSEATAFKAEIMSGVGFDSLTIDLQHGLQDYTSMVQAFQGINLQKVTPLVRVAWNRQEYIMKALDAGALGVICPMVNTAEDAQNLVSSLYYPPIGERSIGPIRSRFVFDDYLKQANQEILGFAMIETKQAVENLEQILEVPHLSGIYIGPSDLSMSHGFASGFDREEPEMLKIIEAIAKQTKAKGLFAGIHTGTAAYAARMLELGFDLVTVSSDILAMLDGLQRAINPLLSGFAKQSQEQLTSY